MKFLTIRMRVTLWYAFFMLLLVVFSAAFIMDLSSKAKLTNQKQSLVETVTDGIREIDDLNRFDYFESGIYLLLYDENKEYIKGVVPEGFSVSKPLHSDSIRTIEFHGQDFYIYDMYFEKAGRGYWMRGLVPQSAPDVIGQFMVRFASGFLPILVLVTCVIGYFITKRAFRPVKKIQETAQSIADSDQLSLRIGLPEGKDEIARLGKTVDHMLDKLQKSFEKEKQFTSDVSHELRTPIAVILTESEYALEHAESLREAKESIKVVNRQANRMSDLINQLLFFSRSENGTLQLNRESFDVFSVVSQLAQDYQLLADMKNITISITDRSATDLWLTSDKTLFTRCLSNIIQNAINYGDSGGHIDIEISQEADYLAIAVTDDGMGISAENLEKIWDRFYQVEESRSKTNGNSMGLGLSMVKTIVEKHGGHVAVTSVPGKGSTFSLYFPL